METDVNKLAEIVQRGIAAARGGGSEAEALYAPSFYASSLEGQNSADKYNTAVTVDNQKRAAAAAEASAGDYKIVQKEDGGFDFFDPSGNKIDIVAYAAATGKRPVDILKYSENPTDMQYVQDHANMQDFVSAVQNKDTNAINQYIDAAKQNGVNLEPYTKSKGGLNEMMKQFKKFYQRYYKSELSRSGVGSSMFPAGTKSSSYGLDTSDGI